MNTWFASLVTVMLSAPYGGAQVLPRTGRVGGAPPITSAGSAGLAASAADIQLLRLSPDESRLVYLADAERDELVELYAIGARGGTPVKLSQPFVDGRGGVNDFVISPDGQRVLYLADHAAPARWELYSVPIDGGPVVKISRPRTTGAITRGEYHITPDGRCVVFVDRESTLRDLFVAPLDGRPVTKLSRSQGQVNAQSVQLAPGGARVVYQSMSGTASFTIHSVRLDVRDDPIVLASGVISFGMVACEITPDGGRVVYGGDSSEPNLLSLPIDGSASPVQLNGPFVAPGMVGQWNLTPGGKNVVYHSNEEGVAQLYSAPVDGSAPAVRITASAGETIFLLPELSSGSGRVAYPTNPAGRFEYELQSAPLAGDEPPAVLSTPGQNLSLSLPSIAGGWGPLVRLTPDGGRALYLASDPARRTAMFTVPLDGSTPPTRIADLAAGDWIRIYYFPSADGRPADVDLDPVRALAVYVAVGLETANGRLFSVPLDGSAPARELSGDQAAGAEGISLFVTASRSGRVYYVADSLEPGVFELFAVPIDGSRRPRQLVGF